MIFGQSFYVFRVVEHSLALHLNVARIILPKALKAGPTDYCSVRPPVSSRQLAEPVCTCADASVNNRNQVTVGNQIQHIASPGPVHTREEHVAIERRAISLLFINRRHHWRGAKVRPVARSRRNSARTSTLRRPTSRVMVKLRRSRLCFLMTSKSISVISTKPVRASDSAT